MDNIDKAHLGIELSQRAEGIHELQQELAASQAREKVLRDALEYILPDTPDQCRVKNNALFLADDDTALKAALAAERERCAKVCGEIEDDYNKSESRKYAELKTDAETGAGNCRFAIRSLGD